MAKNISQIKVLFFIWLRYCTSDKTILTTQAAPLKWTKKLLIQVPRTHYSLNAYQTM